MNTYEDEYQKLNHISNKWEERGLHVGMAFGGTGGTIGAALLTASVANPVGAMIVMAGIGGLFVGALAGGGIGAAIGYHWIGKPKQREAAKNNVKKQNANRRTLDNTRFKENSIDRTVDIKQSPSPKPQQEQGTRIRI